MDNDSTDSTIAFNDVNINYYNMLIPLLGSPIFHCFAPHTPATQIHKIASSSNVMPPKGESALRLFAHHLIKVCGCLWGIYRTTVDGCEIQITS